MVDAGPERQSLLLFIATRWIYGRTRIRPAAEIETGKRPATNWGPSP